MVTRATAANRTAVARSKRKKKSAGPIRTSSRKGPANETAKKPAKKSADRAAKRKLTPATAAAARLIPPPNAVTVRMYRIGHGDCFLLAFPPSNNPVYVLIDCGFKPGSPAFINPSGPVISSKDIVNDMRAATGGRLDVAVITHEHQDHVNGITTANFKGFTIGEAWFAWTERPDDKVAEKLRKQYKDKLLGLFAARNRLAAAEARKVDRFLEFEVGGDDSNPFNPLGAAAMLGAAGAGESMNKISMKVFKDLAEKQNGVKFLVPHQQIYKVPRTENIRVFALGPPRDPDLLTSLDPEGTEKFHSLAMAAASAGNYFAAAAAGKSRSPFAQRYRLSRDAAFRDREYGNFFQDFYGRDPDWRRIDDEWLLSGEALALDMNKYTNNTSLALAFELGKGGKVLLFAADAQRGNWISWSKKTWKDGSQSVTARDLLGRTVLYKVGHHGSHNATLDGKASDDYPNLGWMAGGEYEREFTAMITAVRAWAETQEGWDHPLKSIKDALLAKAAGRVFQTDTDLEAMKIVGGGSPRDWEAFRSRTMANRLYFDYTVVIS